MPYSTPLGKKAIKQWIFKHIQTGSYILDLGCGYGTYADLIGNPDYIMDAVEVYEPYLEQCINKYRSVYCMNLMDFPFLQNYDLIIMGDVLEHLTVEDAQAIIPKLLSHCKWLLIAVPFKLPQDSVDGNDYETHLQPELDFQEMQSLYPQLQLLLYLENDKLMHFADGSPYNLRYAYYIAKGALYNE